MDSIRLTNPSQGSPKALALNRHWVASGEKKKALARFSFLVRLFRRHADDLELLRLQKRHTVKLEVDVLEQKRPNLVAKSVGVEMALWLPRQSHSANSIPSHNAILRLWGEEKGEGRFVCVLRACYPRCNTDLEGQSRLHFFRQNLLHDPVEVDYDLHGKLWLDEAFIDELVDSVHQRGADTDISVRHGHGTSRGRLGNLLLPLLLLFRRLMHRVGENVSHRCLTLLMNDNNMGNGMVVER